MIFIAFAFGCNIACSVETARYLGAKDYAGVRTTVSTTQISSCVLCLKLIAPYFRVDPALGNMFLKSAKGLAPESGVSFLRIVSPCDFVVAATLVSNSVLWGSGLMK